VKRPKYPIYTWQKMRTAAAEQQQQSVPAAASGQGR
jgi:hypothetical protein